jgi:lysine 2,3-aminomutase
VKWELAFDYLREHTEIRDVIISGGDPLTMNDSKIEYLLSNLRAIKHIEILRIGTKVPVVLAAEDHASAVSMLKKYHPLFLSIHFTHPDELTPETRKACDDACRRRFAAGKPDGALKGSMTIRNP